MKQIDYRRVFLIIYNPHVSAAMYRVADQEREGNQRQPVAEVLSFNHSSSSPAEGGHSMLHEIYIHEVYLVGHKAG